MMTEISLNILDVTENSTRAGASVVHITVEVDEEKDLLRVLIEDNGCGMSKEQLASVKDPFFTTRTTRKVGLGVPFFREAALQANGSFDIDDAAHVKNDNAVPLTDCIPERAFARIVQVCHVVNGTRAATRNVCAKSQRFRKRERLGACFYTPKR